jgi:hypothetical protein
MTRRPFLTACSTLAVLLACSGCASKRVEMAVGFRCSAYSHVVLAHPLDPIDLRPAIVSAFEQSGYVVVDSAGMIPGDSRAVAADFSYVHEWDLFHETLTAFFLEVRDLKTREVLATARWSGSSPRSAQSILSGMLRRLVRDLRATG